MPGLFELANELAIRSVGRRLSWTASTGNETIPSTASDGFDLNKAPVTVVTADFTSKSPGSTATADLDIYLYYADSPVSGIDTGRWVCVTYDGALSFSSARPLVEKLDTAGAQKIELVISNEVDGNAAAAAGRAILE